MLTKALESVRVFAENTPSLRDLVRGRRRRFDDVECVLPSRVGAGESLSVTVSLWDEYLRLLEEYSGTFAFASTDPDATLPGRLSVTPADDPVQELHGVEFETPGIQYLTLTDEEGRRFVSNPVEVSASEPETRLYWGDIHLHSQFSDGAGTMTRGFAFGRDVMDLDVVAYADHDTMGFFIPPRLQRRRMHRGHFDRIRDVTEANNDPGEFVTLFAYEWTKQPNEGGHVNVYFEEPDDAELFDSITPETNRYEKLWRALREWQERHDSDVLTVPHHPAEAMYPFDFSAVDYDDDLAPLVEVYSQWGSSELPGSEGNPNIDRVTVVKNNENWHVDHGSSDPDADLSTYTLAGDVVDDEPVTGMRWDDERGSRADVYYLRVEQADTAGRAVTEAPDAPECRTSSRPYSRRHDGGMAWAGPVWAEPAA